jgi:glycosyltransferase involved in cell wall biosynthesis
MNVGMLVDNAFTDDQRVFRAASSLARTGFTLTVLAMKGLGLPESENVDGIRIRRVFSPALFDVKQLAYRRAEARRWAAANFDVLHCHDHWMLDLGARIKRLRPESILIYDSHELFHGWPLNLSRQLGSFVKLKATVLRKYLIWRERANARLVSHLITVNQSVAERLYEHFILEAPPLVVRNVPVLEQCEPGPPWIRERFRIPSDHRILVFIGASLHARTLNLEAVIDQFGDVPRVALVFISGGSGTTNEVIAYAERRRFRNVFFHPRLAPADITRYLASCDVGLVPTWNRKHLSYWLALDNKLFHYIMAELPVLATEQPEYREIVERYEVGVCVDPDRPGAYREGFERIVASYRRFKENSRRAKMVLNWEQEEHALLQFYEKLAQEASLRNVAGGVG